MKSYTTSALALLAAGTLVVPQHLFAADEAAETSAPAAAESATETLELKDPVAEVNGEKISKAELEEAFNEAIGQAGIEPAMLSAEQKLAGYRQLLDDMITDKLVATEAKSIEVTDADVDAELESIKAQFPTPEVFEEQLKQSGQSMDQIRAMVKEGMRQRKWVESQVEKDVEVTEADAKKFYDENTTEFSQPEQVEASHILFLVPEDASDEVVKQKEEAAKAALERAKGSEDFNELAKELSEEPGAEMSGGQLGFFSKERMVPEFSEAAFGQDKGAITGPVRTDFGFHIIKVTDKKPAGTMEFDEIKEQLQAFLEDGKRREAVQGLITKLREDAEIVVHLPEESPSPAAPAEAPAETN